MAKQKVAGCGRADSGRRRRQQGADDPRRRRARRNRQAAMARARTASPNGPERSAERAALIEEFLMAATRGDPIGGRDVEFVAAGVQADIVDAEGLQISTRTIRRHAERLGLVAEHNGRR